MKALRFHTFGPPDVLAIEEIAKPEPAPGELLIRVSAAGINPADIKNVAGHFSSTTLPRTPGRDFSGVVAAGSRLVGEEVWGSGPNLGVGGEGVQAEFVSVPEDAVVRKPRILTMEEAAAVGVPFLTAWTALMRAAEIKPGETVSVIGGKGSVGSAAMQIAAWKGARPIAVDKGDPLPERVDVVFDTVGGPMFEPSLRSLGPRGRHVAITSTGGQRVSFNLVDFYHNESKLIGVDSNRLSAREIGEIAEELNRGFESGALKPPKIEAVPFEDAAAAYRRMAGGKAAARLVLRFAR